MDTLTPKPVVEPGPGTNRITYVMTTFYKGSHPVKIENSHRLIWADQISQQDKNRCLQISLNNFFYVLLFGR